jgi:poly(hydroxyalkanoate) depolymerase family esterase
MSVENRRARRRPVALLAAAFVVVAALWAVGGQPRALAATMRAHTLGPRAARQAYPPTTATHPPSKPRGSTPAPVGLSSGSYTNSAGTLNYELYVPSNYPTGTAMPLVVALHGCSQTADSYRLLSGWDTFGQHNGFIVLFPQQSRARNSLLCWNWFKPADTQRGSGEPAIIAGMVGMVTSAVKPLYTVDTNSVYVAGFSAGGAMANVMGATYPDMFAAVGSGSGCEYDGYNNGSGCPGSPGPAATTTGYQAYKAMGSYALVIPAIVFQGDADTVVDPANAPLIVQQWQVTDQYVLGPTCQIPTAGQSANYTSAGGQSYTVTNYPDAQCDVYGNQLIQYVSVPVMGHAWSGGSSSQQYSDPAGPSETAMMYAFFATHFRR